MLMNVSTCFSLFDSSAHTCMWNRRVLRLEILMKVSIWHNTQCHVTLKPTTSSQFIEFFVSACLVFYLFVCLFVLCVCLSICLFVCLTVCLFVYLSVCLFVCLSVCLFVCLSVCLFVCSSVWLFVCLSVLQLAVYFHIHLEFSHKKALISLFWILEKKLRNKMWMQIKFNYVLRDNASLQCLLSKKKGLKAGVSNSNPLKGRISWKIFPCGPQFLEEGFKGHISYQIFYISSFK